MRGTERYMSLFVELPDVCNGSVAVVHSASPTDLKAMEGIATAAANLRLFKSLSEVLGMIVKADMTPVVYSAASLSKCGRNVAPIGLGGKDNNVVQAASMPSILDPNSLISRVDCFNLNSEVAPFIIGDNKICPAPMVD